jgi:hypothetical protein
MLFYTSTTPPRPLPFRIVLADGSIRTDATNQLAEGHLSDADIAAAGYYLAEMPPAYNAETQVIAWAVNDWSVRDKTADELDAELQARHEATPNLSRAQFAMVVAGAGVITAAEALDWIKGDGLPALATQAIAALPAASRPFAEIKFYAADQISRSSDLVEMLRLNAGFSHDQLDALFAAGVAL